MPSYTPHGYFSTVSSTCSLELRKILYAELFGNILLKNPNKYLKIQYIKVSIFHLKVFISNEYLKTNTK